MNTSQYHHVTAPDAPSDLLFLCDHATNFVPEFVRDLGLSAQDMARHIAFDPGAEAVALLMAAQFEAATVASRFSRLVIDPNRGADDPTLVMQLYDGTIISGNAGLTANEIAERRTRLYDPYHAAIRSQIDRIMARGQTPKLISLHSFTPKLRGKPARPWQIGVLYAHDTRLAHPLLASLRDDADLTIGDNEPYNGALKGDCMDQHGLSRGIAHVLIEVRNDLIATAKDQSYWADRLTTHLGRALATL